MFVISSDRDGAQYDVVSLAVCLKMNVIIHPVVLNRFQNFSNTGTYMLFSYMYGMEVSYLFD